MSPIPGMMTYRPGIYGRADVPDLGTVAVMLEFGLDFSAVITQRFPYQEFEKGFAAMRSGQCGNVILDWRRLQ
jgi:threonine 3-dehydrogenase